MLNIKPLTPVKLLSLCRVDEEEQFTSLLEGASFKLVHIHSPSNFESEVFNQEEDEFVVLMQGEAVLKCDGKVMTLHAGEGLLIPAGTSHAVLKTSDTPQCIWMALHYR